jgi:hypothetical protein
MDAIQLYSSTLEQLNRTVIKMTSPEWNAKVQESALAQRQQVLAELLRVQHARLVLGNAVLQNIAEDLKANEQGLLDGQQSLQAALDKMAAVESVLNDVRSFINVVARIVPLL